MDAAACRLDPALHGHSLRCGVIRCDKHRVFVTRHPQQWYPNENSKNNASELVGPQLDNASTSFVCIGLFLPNFNHPYSFLVCFLHPCCFSSLKELRHGDFADFLV